MAEQNNQQNNIQVKINPEMENGVFSNAVSVHVNQNEVILDFGYILPNSQPMTISIASRVNMTHQTAESFMNLLANAMNDWKKQQTDKK